MIVARVLRIAVLLLGISVPCLAETQNSWKAGPCTLPSPEEDGSCKRFSVPFGRSFQAEGIYAFFNSEGKSTIEASCLEANPTAKPIYSCHYVAFFDREDRLLGCTTSPLSQKEPGISSKACLYADVPAGLPEPVVSYKLACYESDQMFSISRPPFTKPAPGTQGASSGKPEVPNWRVFWAGNEAGRAFTAEGPCRLRPGKFVITPQNPASKNLFHLPPAPDAKLAIDSYFFLEQREGAEFWAIHANFEIRQTHSERMYGWAYVAFFDELGQLLGCTGGEVQQGLTNVQINNGRIEGKEVPRLHVWFITLPEMLYEKIVSYKMTFYEVPDDRQIPERRLPPGLLPTQ